METQTQERIQTREPQTVYVVSRPIVNKPAEPITFTTKLMSDSYDPEPKPKGIMQDLYDQMHEVVKYAMCLPR